MGKDTEQTQPRHRPLGHTPCDCPPAAFSSIHCHSMGSAIRTLFYPAESASIQAMSRVFIQENAVGIYRALLNSRWIKHPQLSSHPLSRLPCHTSTYLLVKQLINDEAMHLEILQFLCVYQANFYQLQSQACWSTLG